MKCLVMVWKSEMAMAELVVMSSASGMEQSTQKMHMKVEKSEFTVVWL